MTTVVHPTTYIVGRYHLTCPDCHRVRWGTGTCPGCRARLIGPWTRSAWIDRTRHTWFIAADGSAELFTMPDDPEPAA